MSLSSRFLRVAWFTACAGCLLLAGTACGDDEENGGVVGPAGSADLPTHAELLAALETAVGNPPSGNGGFNLEMWATVVDRSGIVRAIVFSGPGRGDQWLGSRVISAQKANTANDFSLPLLALSTANLFTAVQPGGSLFGLQESNPVNIDAAYGGDADDYGTENDFMLGKRIGGVNVFGGGLALYNSSGEIIGAVGVSGDTSCADHNIAWKVRDALVLDYVPGGVADGGNDDNIIYDVTLTPEGHSVSASGFGHPECGIPLATTVGTNLPTSHPISP
ncbi:MAG: GlcG/HbpS family heme-binding protein [Gemmatimonadales bacterium]